MVSETGGGVEFADAFERVHDDCGFSGELRFVGQMLPLASGALAEVGARRIHPVVGRRYDVDHLGRDVLPTDGGDFGHHSFTGGLPPNTKMSWPS